jgi:nucleoside-diphosphate-sugar epimerase
MPFGLINNRRSFLFIENLINFIRICIESDSSDNHTFLISDDQDLSIFELIKIMKNILKSKSIIIPIPKIILKILFYLLNKKSLNNKLLESLTLDCTKAKKILSWKPDSDIKNNLRKTFSQ